MADHPETLEEWRDYALLLETSHDEMVAALAKGEEEKETLREALTDALPWVSN